MKSLHFDLLLTLHASGEFGLLAPNLVDDMRRGRHRSLTRPEVDAALRDLADRAYATLFTTDAGTARWRATGRGTSALREEGLL